MGTISIIILIVWWYFLRLVFRNINSSDISSYKFKLDIFSEIRRGHGIKKYISIIIAAIIIHLLLIGFWGPILFCYKLITIRQYEINNFLSNIPEPKLVITFMGIITIGYYFKYQHLF